MTFWIKIHLLRQTFVMGKLWLLGVPEKNVLCFAFIFENVAGSVLSSIEVHKEEHASHRRNVRTWEALPTETVRPDSEFVASSTPTLVARLCPRIAPTSRTLTFPTHKPLLEPIRRTACTPSTRRKRFAF